MIAALAIATVVIIRMLYLSKGLILITILDVLLGIALIFAVFHMRRTIRHTNFASPNDKLVVIHTLNFIVWAIIFGALKLLNWYELHE